MPDTASFWNERGAHGYETSHRRSEPARSFGGQLTELASTDFESWAKESYEIATKIAYRNGGQIGSPKAGAMDCTMVAAAPGCLRDTWLVRARLVIEG